MLFTYHSVCVPLWLSHETTIGLSADKGAFIVEVSHYSGIFDSPHPPPLVKFLDFYYYLVIVNFPPWAFFSLSI